MKNQGLFTFLGTSASAGVPVIGCKCDVCVSGDLHNARLRPSGLLKINGKTFLIDVGPDFRQQALRANIDHLDGLILTHTHYDHIAGIDELRIFYLKSKKELPCLLSEESFEDLKRRYYYLFQPIGEVPTLSAQIQIHLLPEDMGQVEFQGQKFSYFSYFQGGTKVQGFRVGDFAYVSDIKDFDESIFLALKGVKYLVLSALRESPSYLHLSVDEAVAFAEKVGSPKTYLTHISHAIDHKVVNQRLPSFVQLGYDGQEIAFELI